MIKNIEQAWKKSSTAVQ